MKSIVAKVSAILAIIFIVVSICGISSVDCLRGKLPINKTIINSKDIMYGLNYGDMKSLPYKLIPLFGAALVLIVLTSILKFTKTNKAKSIINIIISLVPTVFVVVTHNYIWFLILINIYLLFYICIDSLEKNKVNIIINIITIIISILNFIQMVKHLNLEFNPSNIIAFEKNLIIVSENTLKNFSLWLTPYTILLIKEIITKHKTSRTAK